MKKQTLLISTLLIILSVLAGDILEPLSLFQKNKGSNEQCIPPLGTWSYRFSPWLSPSALAESKTQVPLSPWLEPPAQLEIQDPPNNWQYVSDLPDSPARLVSQTDDEIWLYTYPNKLWKYKVSSSNWQEYSTVDKQNIAPDIRYFRYFNQRSSDGSSDGTVLAVNEIFKTPTESYYVISHYDKTTDQFQHIKYDEKIFNAYDFDIRYAEQDQNGVFWMKASQKTTNDTDSDTSRVYAIFSFDSVTGKIEQHGDFEWIDAYLAIGSDGNIWINSKVDSIKGVKGDFHWLTGEDNSVLYRELTRFNPYTNEKYPYPNFILPGSGSIWFDRVGHLWVGSGDSSSFSINKFPSWVDLSDSNVPVAYKIIPPAELLFFFDLDLRNMMLWDTLAGVHQTVDGSYLFGAYNGLVKLNPKTGRWCRLTNSETLFTEDNHGNMWLAVSGKLYKYSANQ